MITSLLKQTCKRVNARLRSRHELAEHSGKILSASKRAIFALHRQDRDAAEHELQDAAGVIKQGMALCKRDATLMDEGSWHAALEEYTEACLFLNWHTHQTLDLPALPHNDPEILIGGLADVIGEFARYAVLRATDGDRDAVEALYLEARSVVELFLSLNLTGSLRTKFDQSKQHLRKLEEIRYDLSRV